MSHASPVFLLPMCCTRGFSFTSKPVNLMHHGACHERSCTHSTKLRGSLQNLARTNLDARGGGRSKAKPRPLGQSHTARQLSLIPQPTSHRGGVPSGTSTWSRCFVLRMAHAVSAVGMGLKKRDSYVLLRVRYILPWLMPAFVSVSEGEKKGCAATGKCVATAHGGPFCICPGLEEVYKAEINFTKLIGTRAQFLGSSLAGITWDDITLHSLCARDDAVIASVDRCIVYSDIQLPT